MKKLVFALFVAALLVGVAGSAFAAGHVNPEPFKPVVVVSSDVTVEGADVVSVTSADLGDVPQSGIAVLASSNGATYAINTAFKLNLSYMPGTTEAVIDLTKILDELKKVDPKAAPNVVLLMNKVTGKVVDFVITNKKITVKPVAEFFTENTLTLSTRTFPDSSSGCSTGAVAPAFLLLLAPLAVLLKK